MGWFHVDSIICLVLVKFYISRSSKKNHILFKF